MALHYGIIYATTRFRVFELQLLSPIFLAVAVGNFLSAAKIISQIKLPSFVREPIRRISGMTLDIYLVQFVIIAFCEKYAFPVGYLSAGAMILFAAAILGRCGNACRALPSFLTRHAEKAP